MELPINQGDWNDKYGELEKEKELVVNALEAMKKVQGLSSQFGVPTSIQDKLAQDGGYLTNLEPPSEIYGHIIWLASQINNAASTYNYTFEYLKDVLSPSMGTKAERAGYLKEILVGQGGLVSTAEDMGKKTDALITKFAVFNGKIQDAHQQLQTYTGQQSQILSVANQKIGALEDQIQQLLSAADAAEKAWKDYTIAAVTSSIGITIISAGLLAPLAVGLGIGLGKKAGDEKEKYNALMHKIGRQSEERNKKSRLVMDLWGLNRQIGKFDPALTSFRNHLEAIQGFWVSRSAKFKFIAEHDEDKLSNYTWVIQTAKILEINKMWEDLATTTEHFITHSLVSYNQDTTWGQQIA